MVRVKYIKLTCTWFKICILIYCLCYRAILVQTEYREFASIVYHKTDAHVKWTDTEIEIEIGGALFCQRMLAFL